MKQMQIQPFYINDVSKSPESETSFVGKLFEKAKNLPSSVPQAIRQELANLSAELNGGKEELKTAKKEDAENLLSKLKEKAKNGLQKYVREGKTAEFKNKNEYEKLLAHAKSFDEIRAGDILRMRASGANISNFLLTNKEGDEIDLNKNIEALKNQDIFANFGENRSLNANIGLGDILPHEVRKVEITKPNGEKVIGTLGTQDSRKGRKERIGYYDNNGVYIAIYHGYGIRILETGTISNEEKEIFETLENTRLRKLRTQEIANFIIARNGYKKISLEEIQSLLNQEFPNKDDQDLFQDSVNNLNERIVKGERMREVYKDGIGSREKFIGKFGWYLRDVIGKDFPGIPPHVLVNLFNQESGCDPTKENNRTHAYGFGQITPDTFDFLREHINNSYQRENPYDQIHASAAYLNWIMKNNNCDIMDAIIYYHMGPYVKRYMDSNNTAKLEEYIDSNPAVVKYMPERTWNGYWIAARSYYLNQPNLLTSLDLSKTGTEVATQLGDFVMSTYLPETGSGSCGKAVGILLNGFGIEELPQTGRDGKNWDNILEPRVQIGQFKKVPIKHPDEAGAGAILVYDGSGALGSTANKNYGHVEIKGSDGRYYSYYEGQRAGGSAANNERNPEEFRKLTGFTGYAYYPITKKV